MNTTRLGFTGPSSDYPGFTAKEAAAVPGLHITVTNDAGVLAAACIGEGVTLTGTPTFSGNALQAGTYTGGDEGEFGLVMTMGSTASGPLPALASGVILSTGKAADAKGPNTTNTKSTDFGSVGTPAGGDETFRGDIATLTFDVIPAGDTLHLQICFGSEEYTEFLFLYPDYFHIKVNGVIVSLVPGSSTQIGTNTVYPGGLIDADGMNADYYTDLLSNVSDGQLQFDGCVLCELVVPVTPGETQTIELLVADTEFQGGFGPAGHPGRIDSGLFLGAMFCTGIPVAATFANGELVIGLTWIIVTLRDGETQYVWSDRPLPDPSTYYLGWKEPRVLRWGHIRRALSSVLDGQYETTDFSVTLDDNDHFLRSMGDQWFNATVAVYMISDADRRALNIPTTVYRGVIRDAKPTGVLEYQLSIKDPFAEGFSVANTTNLMPRRVVLQADFPNCGQPLLSSSASGYVIDGDVDPDASPGANDDVIPVRGGTGVFASGDRVTIDGNVYTISKSSSMELPAGSDEETWILLQERLVGLITDGQTITQSPTHAMEPATGKRIPFVYGHISDRRIVDGIDAGDGQGIPLYVGDRVLDDGFTYAEFVWSGWACYSPDGKPIEMVYFWNNDIENGWGDYFPEIGTIEEEAGSGGRIVMPGYDNWTTNGFTDPFIDYNGRRYTVIFLRGIFRDWALGIASAPPNLGGFPFTVNGYGAEDAADGTGELITNILQQYKHAVINLFPPKGDPYQSGTWLTSPTFPDDPTLPMIDEESFDLADAQSGIYVADGFRGDFIIGANNEAISARDLIARFNLSAGVQCGFNNKTQFFVSMVNTDLETTTLAVGLGWVRDIFTRTFAIQTLTKDLYTAIAFQHTQDYVGRTEGGWRSKTADDGITHVENTIASGEFGSTTTYETMSLYMLRGKNRSTDIEDYERGTLTIAAVLALALARLSAIQHLPALQTGPAGFKYELADVLPITHFEGYGSEGWVEEPVRIERTEIDPSEWVEYIEGYQISPMLES